MVINGSWSVNNLAIVLSSASNIMRSNFKWHVSNFMNSKALPNPIFLCATICGSNSTTGRKHTLILNFHNYSLHSITYANILPRVWQTNWNTRALNRSPALIQHFCDMCHILNIPTLGSSFKILFIELTESRPVSGNTKESFSERHYAVRH